MGFVVVMGVSLDCIRFQPLYDTLFLFFMFFSSDVCSFQLWLVGLVIFIFCIIIMVFTCGHFPYDFNYECPPMRLE